MIEVMPRRRSNFRHTMHQYVDDLCAHYPTGDMALFSIICLGFDGGWSSGFEMHKDSPFGVTLLPAILAEIQRKRNMENVARDIFNGKL